MPKPPLNSFLDSLFIFTLFIGMSFGVAFAVSSYTAQRDAAAQQAAAFEALVVEGK